MKLWIFEVKFLKTFTKEFEQLYAIYRGVGLIRTMEIVKMSSKLARSSELAQPCGFKSFDLKNDFLLRGANYLSYIGPNVASTYSLTQFLHT